MKRDGDTFEYWNDPESTRSAHLGEYVTVGDEGFVDRDGWLYLAGRAIERINSGAIKFYPSEVEDVLLGDPDVIRAAVFGTASRHMGEVVVAIVELDASTTLAAVKSRLFERCRARLARPKWPVRILSATLPTLPSGKVDRLQTRRLISPDSDTTIDPPATGG
jgi:long-chain acyl-CoA synthetase